MSELMWYKDHPERDYTNINDSGSNSADTDPSKYIDTIDLPDGHYPVYVVSVSEWTISEAGPVLMRTATVELNSNRSLKYSDLSDEQRKVWAEGHRFNDELTARLQKERLYLKQTCKEFGTASSLRDLEGMSASELRLESGDRYQSVGHILVDLEEDSSNVPGGHPKDMASHLDLNVISVRRNPAAGEEGQHSVICLDCGEPIPWF